MTDKPRSIFREEVVKRYLQANDESVFPRILAPRTFIYLWVLVGLSVISLLIAWCISVPVMIPGQAIVIETQNESGYDLELAILFSSEYRQTVKTGQSVFVSIESNNKPTQQQISTVAPRTLSPEEAMEIYAASICSPLLILQPVSVVFSEFHPPNIGLKSRDFRGSVYTVEIEIGTQRLITLIPVIGGLIDV